MPINRLFFRGQTGLALVGVAALLAMAPVYADDSATPAANATVAPTPQWVNPDVLSTPANPAPAGAPAAVTGDALAKLAPVASKNGHWWVTIGDGAALPLVAMTANAPQLLAYYPPAPGTPVTQPGVLVYRAGVAGPETGPAAGLVVDRAMIFRPGEKLPVADALWAVRTPDGALTPSQPAWQWTADKLVVENPFEKTSQTISLAPRKK